jgi:hypothetical protein
MSDGSKVSNVDLVKAYLKNVRGNDQFTAKDVANVTGLTSDQASKALRSIDYVQRPEKGMYLVKGRHV